MGSQVLKLATQPTNIMKTIAVLATYLLACVVGEAEPSADAHYLGHYGSAYGYGLQGYGYGHHNSYNGYGYGHSPYGSHYGYAHHQGKREAEPTAVAEASADAHYGYSNLGYHGYGHYPAYGYHHQGKREAEPTATAEASADAHYGSYGYGGYGYGHGYGYGGYGHGYGHGYYGHSYPTYG